MAHLTCLKHGKRVFVNPETKSVLHRSEAVKCDSDVQIGNVGIVTVPNDMQLCTYCGFSKFDIQEYSYDVCNERWNTSRDGNGQPHVFLG